MLDAVIPQSEATVRERLNAIAGTQLLSIRQQGLDTGITVLLRVGKRARAPRRPSPRAGRPRHRAAHDEPRRGLPGPSLGGVGWVRLEGMVDASLWLWPTQSGRNGVST